MLSFEVADKGETIKIFCDKEGLKILSDSIERLKKTDSDEIRLYSPLCGGKDLNETNPWGVKAVSVVVISTGGD